MSILAFGTNRDNFKAKMLWMVFYASIYSTVYFFALDRIYGLIQLAVVLAILLLATYNGERGRSTKINKFIKWVFYAYYPLHLLVISGFLASKQLLYPHPFNR